MNKKTVISNVIVSAIVNLLLAGILIGAGVLVLIFPQIFGIAISVVFALIGISLLLTTVPNLIGGIANVKQKKGRFDLIFSIVTMVIGIALAVYGLISALILIGVSGLNMPIAVAIIIKLLRWIICGLIALYLIVLPVIRIVKAEKKFMQLKAELVKVIFGVLIVVLLICGMLATLLNSLIGITLIAVGILTALFAVLILIVGLVGIKKADKGFKTADGVVAIGVDVDGDGTIDEMHVDTDGDGRVDTVVTTNE